MPANAATRDAPDITFYNILLKSCIDNYQLASKLFDKMTAKNISLNLVSYNQLLAALAKGGKDELAIVILQKVRNTPSITPNRMSYTHVIRAFEMNSNWCQAIRALQEMCEDLMKSGMDVRGNSNQNGVRTISSDRRNDRGNSSPNRSESRQSHPRIGRDNDSSENLPDIVLFNSVLGACKESKEWKHALQLFNYLEVDGNSIKKSGSESSHSPPSWTAVLRSTVRPNIKTFNILMACCRERPDLVLQVWRMIQPNAKKVQAESRRRLSWDERRALQPSVVSYNSLISSLGFLPGVVGGDRSKIGDFGKKFREIFPEYGELIAKSKATAADGKTNADPAETVDSLISQSVENALRILIHSMEEKENNITFSSLFTTCNKCSVDCEFVMEMWGRLQRMEEDRRAWLGHSDIQAEMDSIKTKGKVVVDRDDRVDDFKEVAHSNRGNHHNVNSNTHSTTPLVDDQVMISLLGALDGKPKHALDAFLQMKFYGLKPDASVYRALLNSLLRGDSEDAALAAHYFQRGLNDGMLSCRRYVLPIGSSDCGEDPDLSLVGARMDDTASGKNGRGVIDGLVGVFEGERMKGLGNSKTSHENENIHKSGIQDIDSETTAESFNKQSPTPELKLLPPISADAAIKESNTACEVYLDLHGYSANITAFLVRHMLAEIARENLLRNKNAAPNDDSASRRFKYLTLIVGRRIHSLEYDLPVRARVEQTLREAGYRFHELSFTESGGGASKFGGRIVVEM
jgi:hypothetical protein